MAYAPLFASFMALWPFIAYAGGQGFTVLAVILMLCALPFLRLAPLPAYALGFCGFLAWAGLTTLWAPEAGPWVSGSLTGGDFALKSPALRIIGTGLACALIIAAAKNIPVRRARISAEFLSFMPALQWALLFLTAVYLPYVLQLAAPFSDPVKSMPANIQRNGNAFMLIMPLFLGGLWLRPLSLGGKFSAILIFITALYIFSATETQAALAGAICGLGAMAIVALFPINGFKILMAGLGSYIALAPVLIGWAFGELKAMGAPLPASFTSRIYCWQLTGEKMVDTIVFGQGMEASESWQETFSDRPDWLAEMGAEPGSAILWENFPIVPGHPHNMPLQIWAETGMIGAFLFALTLCLLGWRLKAPQDWPWRARLGAAGLIGGAAALSSVAYDMWNEAYWASIALIAGAIMITARQDTRKTLGLPL